MLTGFENTLKVFMTQKWRTDVRHDTFCLQRHREGSRNERSQRSENHQTLKSKQPECDRSCRLPKYRTISAVWCSLESYTARVQARQRPLLRHYIDLCDVRRRFDPIDVYKVAVLYVCLFIRRSCHVRFDISRASHLKPRRRRRLPKIDSSFGDGASCRRMASACLLLDPQAGLSLSVTNFPCRLLGEEGMRSL